MQHLLHILARGVYPHVLCNSDVICTCTYTALCLGTLAHIYSVLKFDCCFISMFISLQCSLQYNGGGSSGWYAVALQIEDFMTTSSSTALSSVPLQFLVQIFSSSLSCTGNKPVLVGETIPDGACIAVPFTTTFRTSVVAFVGHTSVRYGTPCIFISFVVRFS